jgi:prepilin peptidase CpaA
METVMVGVLAAVLVTAIWTDLRTSRIPNWLTFSAMGFALVEHAWFGGLHGLMFGILGLGVGLGLFFILFISGGIGAGDVKLMAAVGATLGLYGALITGFLTIMAGGIYALGAMIYEWGLVTMCQKLSLSMHTALLTGGKTWGENLQLPFRLRYGVAIATGTILFVLGLHPFRG